MSTPLLDYCPPHLREDLWVNDGFEPHNPDHIADDPTRAMIYFAAEEARKEGLTRAQHLAIEIGCAAYLLDDDLVRLDLIDDPKELAWTMEALRALRSKITRVLGEQRRKGFR